MKIILALFVTVIQLSAHQFSYAEETPAAEKIEKNQTLYVDDKLWITVRAGPESNAEKIAVIQTGISMTLISYKKGADYAKVHTDNNHTGWVLYRYLTSEPIAILKLTKAEKNVTRLQKKNNRLKDSLKTIRSDKKELQQQVRTLKKTNKSLDKNLVEISAINNDAIQTFQQKQTLQKKLDLQKNTLQQLNKDNANLGSRLTLFTISSAIIGLLVGLFIGTIPLRRNSRWRSMP